MSHCTAPLLRRIRMKKSCGTSFIALALGVAFSTTGVAAQSNHHWVATWATAQELAPTVPDAPNVAVSLYVKSSEGTPTAHILGLHTTYLAEGDQTASTELHAVSATSSSYMWLSGIDVEAPQDRFAIVALGDSITDGSKTTVDTN